MFPIDEPRLLRLPLHGWMSDVALDPPPTGPYGDPPAGAVRLITRCPFHAEKTGSCIIHLESHDDNPSASRGWFFCLGCGRRGMLEWGDDSDDTGNDVGFAIPVNVRLVPGQSNPMLDKGVV